MILTSMTALVGTPGTIADGLGTLLGYFAPGDGGGGDFFWQSGNTSGDNGGTIVVVTGEGRWVRIDTTQFNVKWFGAKGDNVNDDTIAIQHCINAADTGRVIFFPKGTYKVTAQLNLKVGQVYRGEQGNYGGVNSGTATELNFTSATGNIHCLNFDATVGSTGPTIEHLFLNCGQAMTGIRYYSSNYSNCYRPTISNVNIIMTEIEDPMQACIWWDPVYLGTIERCSLRGGRIGVKLIACFMNRLINVTTQQGISNNGNPPIAAFYTRQSRLGQGSSFIGGRNVIETCEPLIIYPDAESVMVDTDGALLLRDTALEVNNGGNEGTTAKALIWMHRDGAQSPFRTDILIDGGTVYNSSAASGSGNGRAKYGLLAEANSFNRIIARSVSFRDNPFVVTGASAIGLAVSGADFQRFDIQCSDYASTYFTDYTGWKPSTAYTKGQLVQNGLYIYLVVTAGTSSVSGGPTGTGNGITDGTVEWDFVKENTGPFPLKRQRETNPDVYIVGDPRGVKDNQFINANGSTERFGATWGFFKATVDPGSISDNQCALKLRFDNTPPYRTPMKATVLLRRISEGNAAGRFTIQCGTSGGTNVVGRWDLASIPLNEEREYAITGFAVPGNFPITDFSAWFRSDGSQSLWDGIAVRSIRVEKATEFCGSVTLSGTEASKSVTSANFVGSDISVLVGGNFLLPSTAVIALGVPLRETSVPDPGLPYITGRTESGFVINLPSAPGVGNIVTVPFQITY